MLFASQMPRIGRNANLSLYEALRSYSDVSATSFLVGVACVVAVADVGCAITLYGVVHDWEPGSWWPSVILEHMWGGQSFSKDSADIILMVMARLSVLPLIALMAATNGKPPDSAPVATNAAGSGNPVAGSRASENNGKTTKNDQKKRSLWRRACCFFCRQ
eukprot:jgi/Undpi1/8295/HiC_scaffold_25.g10764.m1